MKNAINKVKEFHLAFGLPSREKPEASIHENEFKLRFDLLDEENKEYLEACKNEDLEKVADALGDLLYVIYGTIITHGMQDKISLVLDEIHKSNMSKLDSDGKPIYREDGKILKSESFFKPDISKILFSKED